MTTPSFAPNEHATFASSTSPMAQLREAQIARWRSGQPIPVETYLQTFPHLSDDDVRVLIVGEFLLRRETGQPADVTDFQRRFPKFANELPQHFEFASKLLDHSPGATRRLEQPPVPGPSSIPGYDIESEIGRGAWGIVYRARHLGLGRIVALKVLQADGSDHRNNVRFIAEGQLIAKLAHPNIVQIFDFGPIGREGLYISLELAEGGTLARRLAGKPIPPHEAAALVEKLANAAGFAHQQKIIHRDIKPANVLLSKDGEPKLADFGLAKQIDVGPGMTTTGAILGTPTYMSPEQARGFAVITPAADVYALGALLYETLTGRPPLIGASALYTLRLVLEQEPVSPRAVNKLVPRDLATICLKCLEKDATKRYPTGDELADDLERFRNGLPIHARPVGELERLWRFVKRKPYLSGLFVTTLISLVAGIMIASVYAYRADQSASAERKARQKAQAETVRAEKALFHSEWLAYSGTLQRVGDEWTNNNTGAAWDWLDSARWDFRGTEFQLLINLLVRGRWPINGHDGVVNSVAVAPKGERFATASDDGTVKLWDFRERTCRFTFGGRSAVKAVAFDATGDWVYSGGDDGVIREWNATTGKERRTFDAHEKTINSIAVDGSWLVSGSADGRVRCWNLANGELKFTGDPHEPVRSVCFLTRDKILAGGDDGVRVFDIVTGAEKTISDVRSIHAVSSTGSLIAFGGDDRIVRLWDVNAEKLLRELPAIPDGVLSLTFSRDGKSLVVGSNDNVARLWDIEDRQWKVTFRGHSQAVNGIGFSLDGQSLVTVGGDQTALVWNLGKQHAQSFTPGGKIIDLAIEPNGERVCALNAKGDLQVWQPGTESTFVKTGPPIGPALAIAYGNDQRLAMIRKDRVIRVINLRNAQILHQIDDAGEVVAIAAFADGTRFISASTDRSIRVWDFATGKQLRQFQATDEPCVLAISPDGKMLAITERSDANGIEWHENGGEIVRLYDIESGREKHTFRDTIAMRSLAFSPDGRRVAAGNWEGITQVWDVTTGERTHRITGPDHSITGIVMTDDGERIITSCEDRTIRISHLESGLPLLLLRSDSGGYMHLALTPSKRFLVSTTADGRVWMWSLERGDKWRTLKGHTDAVREVAVSADGEWLASTSARVDHAVRVWDAKKGRIVFVGESHTGDVTSVAFHPTRSQVVTGATDGTMRVWEVPAGTESRTLNETGSIVGLTFRADGRRIATILANGEVVMRDGTTFDVLYRLPLPITPTSLMFAPDGHLFVGGENGTLVVINVESRTISTPIVHHASAITRIVFASSGEWYLTAGRDGKVIGWDASHREQWSVRPSGQAVLGLDVQADQKQFACSTEDGVVAIYDIATRQKLYQHWPHSGAVTSLQYLNDGGHLVTGSSDTTVKVGDVAR